MGDLFNFEKRTDHWSICDKTATLLSVLRVAVSELMSVAYTGHWKTASAKRNSGRKSRLTEIIVP
jgi:hypothetical protein